jgi:hypothetical protein
MLYFQKQTRRNHEKPLSATQRPSATNSVLLHMGFVALHLLEFAGLFPEKQLQNISELGC